MRRVPRLRILGCVVVVLASCLICAADADNRLVVLHQQKQQQQDEERRKHYGHHMLLFMGGVKSLAALVLIKIKILFIFAAIVAVVVFTVKYLLGATDLGGLYNKANDFVAPPPPQHHPPGPPPYLQPVAHEHHEEHEPVYGQDYHPPIPWGHNGHENIETDWSSYGNSQEAYKNDWSSYGNNQEAHKNDWSSYGNSQEVNNGWSGYRSGGRSLLEVASFYPALREVLLQNFFNNRKRVKRKSNLYHNNASITNRKCKSC